MTVPRKSLFDNSVSIDGLATTFLYALQSRSGEQLRLEVPARIAGLTMWFLQTDVKMRGISHLHEEMDSDWTRRAHTFVESIEGLKHELKHAQWGNVRGAVARLEAERVAINATLAENGVL